MKSGNERDHLQELFKSASMRGTDIRFFTLIDEETVQHEVPYPALRWKWQTVTSTHGSRHRGRSVKKFHTRWLHILDSMVSRGALAKGRSSSTRLNKVFKKHAAAALQPYPCSVMVHASKQALSVVLPATKTSEGNPQVLQVEDPTLV